jgi:creatinine amidohydrolase
VCASIVRHGFRRLMLLNGHGGNVTALNVIAGELARELEADIATSTYWLLSGTASAYAEILEQQKNVRHACEAETSMLLALAPDLVDRDAMLRTDGPMSDVVNASGVYRYRSFAELSESGVLGAPSAASAEKGERLLDAAAEALAGALLDESSWA